MTPLTLSNIDQFMPTSPLGKQYPPEKRKRGSKAQASSTMSAIPSILATAVNSSRDSASAPLAPPTKKRKNATVIPAQTATSEAPPPTTSTDARRGTAPSAPLYNIGTEVHHAANMNAEVFGAKISLGTFKQYWPRIQHWLKWCAERDIP
jgi:hypothetical protein